MNGKRVIWLIVFGFGFSLASGCFSGDGGAGPKAAVENVRQLPRIAGTPTEAGYFDGGLTLLGSGDADSGEALVPKGNTYLMAVRLEVEKETTIVPEEYFVIKGKGRYRPVGISFGDRATTFFDVKKFAADEIKLSLGSSDQITTNDAGKLASCLMSVGDVFLLYRVPGGVDLLRYNGKDHDLRPTTAVALGVEELATVADNDTGNMGGPKILEVEVKRGQLAIAPIDEVETEVFELELTLKGSKYESIELKILEDFFLQGNAAASTQGRKGRRRGNQTRKVFIEYQEERMRLLAGTEYYDNTYKERPMKELVNGGLAVSIEPGQPLTLFCVFPKPPFENGLSLHFPGKPPVDLVPAGDVLGEIRPGIVRGVAKIPRARIIGDPVKVLLINGGIVVVEGSNKFGPMNAGGGKRFLALKFKIEGEQQFVARDYVLQDESNGNFYPVAIAFGNAPARRVPGEGYEAVKLVPGETDLARRLKGKLSYWQYSQPEFLVLFAVPQDLKLFYFNHGNQRLKITPITPPVAWNEIRPNKEAQ